MDIESVFPLFEYSAFPLNAEASLDAGHPSISVRPDVTLGDVSPWFALHEKVAKLREAFLAFMCDVELRPWSRIVLIIFPYFGEGSAIKERSTSNSN